MRSFVLSRAREADYPGVFQEVCQMIGEAATAQIVAQFGGGPPLYIPAKFKPEHHLCKLLGEEIAQQLADEFGGLTVEIPRGVARQIELRNGQIMADRASGMTQGEIARKHTLSIRRVRQITSTYNNTTKGSA